jgi:hypothetical protein
VWRKVTSLRSKADECDSVKRENEVLRAKLQALTEHEKPGGAEQPGPSTVHGPEMGASEVAAKAEAVALNRQVADLADANSSLQKKLDRLEVFSQAFEQAQRKEQGQHKRSSEQQAHQQRKRARNSQLSEPALVANMIRFGMDVGEKGFVVEFCSM